MKQVQQDVMCVLLQALLEKNLITQDVYDKSRRRVLDTLDWPEFFSCSEQEGKEVKYGYP